MKSLGQAIQQGRTTTKSKSRISPGEEMGETGWRCPYCVCGVCQFDASRHISRSQWALNFEFSRNGNPVTEMAPSKYQPRTFSPLETIFEEDEDLESGSRTPDMKITITTTVAVNVTFINPFVTPSSMGICTSSSTTITANNVFAPTPVVSAPLEPIAPHPQPQPRQQSAGSHMASLWIELGVEY
ncbi:hypothetical protein NHQ30_006808 [Ciborinia camelliae]|nr:hypothetical protein NHQ30_006808 [Ciborinia camelliae]